MYKIFLIILIILIVIFSVINLILCINKEKYSNNFLSIQTTFLPRENVLFLDEWIKYHLNLGVDHIYMYNNAGSSYGSIGNNDKIIKDKKNKYNIDYSERTDHFSEQDIHNFLKKLERKYKGKITFIKWQPINKNGEIEYKQTEAIWNFKKKYSNVNNWVALIDIDEFLFSPTNQNLVDLIKKYEEIGLDRLQIRQKKFLDRFLGLDKGVKNVIDNYETIDGIDTTNWSPKNIIKIKNLKNVDNIHNTETKGKMKYLDSNEFRFNHYNVNKKQLDWASNFYQKQIKINGLDNSMKIFKSY